jgi:hypothetical protein
MIKKNKLTIIFALFFLFFSCNSSDGVKEVDFQKIIAGLPWFFKISHVDEQGKTLLEYTNMEFKRAPEQKDTSQHLTCYNEFGDRIWEIKDIDFLFPKLPANKHNVILSKAELKDGHYFMFVAERTEKPDYGFSNIRGIFIKQESGALAAEKTRNFNLSDESIIFSYDSIWEKPIVRLADGRYITSYITKNSKSKYIAVFDEDAQNFSSNLTTKLWHAPNSFLSEGKIYTYKPVIDYKNENVQPEVFQSYAPGSGVSEKLHYLSFITPLNGFEKEFFVSIYGSPMLSRRNLSYGYSDAADLDISHKFHINADNIALDYKRVGLGTGNLNYKFLWHNGDAFIVYTTFTNELAVLKLDREHDKMETVFILQSSSPFELLDAAVIPGSGDFYFIANTTVNKLKASLAFFKVKKSRFK